MSRVLPLTGTASSGVCMGIDYGEKRIGIALSDERGKIAFPHLVFSNDEHAIKHIRDIAESEKVERIVAGDTRTESGKENPITGAFNIFLTNLSRETRIAVSCVSEEGSTAAARAVFLQGEPRGEVSNPTRRREDDSSLDARAAAIILQRFLDTHKG